MKPFPNIDPFPKLTTLANRGRSGVFVHDHVTDTKATLSQLLLDVAQNAERIRDTLDADTLQVLTDGSEDVFICTMLPEGYEFVVSMLAIASIGAAVAPLSNSVLPEEAAYFVALSGARLIMHSPGAKTDAVASAIAAENLLQSNHCNLRFLAVHQASHQEASSSLNTSFEVSNHGLANAERAGLLIFTSGTTGPPKGVVHTWASAVAAAYIPIHQGYQFSASDHYLATFPPQFIGGSSHILSCLLGGTTMEFCRSVYNPTWFWDRILQKDVTLFIIGPAGFAELARYFEENLVPTGRAAEYTAAAGPIQYSTGSAPVPQSLVKKWKEVTGGAFLRIAAGFTEGGGPVFFQRDEHNNEAGEVGYLDIESQYRLEDKDGETGIGQLCVKGPWLFKKYISMNSKIMDGVFTSDGYFRSGDMASERNGCIKLHGRVSTDMIRFAGWKLFGPDVESYLKNIPFIVDAFVLPIDDHRYHHLVGAIVHCARESLNGHSSHTNGVASELTPCPPTALQPTLAEIRAHLSETDLQRYKWPTVLKVLGPDEKLPRTAKGSIAKNEAKKMFFPDGWRDDSSIEQWDISKLWSEKKRAFDWAGID